MSERAAVEAGVLGDSVRRLTATDADALAAFAGQRATDDIDVAHVGLDHWTLFGSSGATRSRV